VIEFESVGKTFRDGSTAVKDLSLTVPSDKITVIVGPSGCGKTTTLRMVNRMLEPTSGRILWDGAPLRSKRKTTLRRQMGYVIQNGGLFPHRTVVDNVGTVPGLLGWDKNKTRNRSMELLDSVGLDRKLAHRYPAQLSGGQQQRVGVARALAADPLVMLMDEPFSAVDPVVRSELHELFLGLQRDLSKTIILITHDIDEAIKLGDQVAILRVGGVLAQVGTPQQLLDEPADAFVEGFVGRDRGFRALSFLPATGLSLKRVRAVRDPSSVTAHEPTLVIDADAKPVGWADGSRPGKVYALGSTFDPEKDSLRAALDAALTSPVGFAVAVSEGRYAGVVGAEDILAQATQSRASVAESVAVRGRQDGSDGGAAESESGSDVAAGGSADDADSGQLHPGDEDSGDENSVRENIVSQDRSTDAPESGPSPESSPSEETLGEPAPSEETDDLNSRDTVSESDGAGAPGTHHVAFAGDVPVNIDEEGPAESAADAEAAPTGSEEAPRSSEQESAGSADDDVYEAVKDLGHPFRRSS
jgi:osmoprotectant transport system ATP-binding protein